MAADNSSYTWATLLSICKNFLPSKVEDSYSATLCNLMLDKAWYAYDWQESLADLPPFWLVPNQQYHGSPGARVPADFAALRLAYFVHLGANLPQPAEIKVRRDIRDTFSTGLPQLIGYHERQNAFKVFPRVPSSAAAPTYLINGVYKKKYVQVTPATLHAAPPFDDTFLGMMIEGIRWGAKVMSGAPDAGQVSYANGQVGYNGQLAAFMAAIDSAAQGADVDDGPSAIAPASSLAYPSIAGSAIDRFIIG